MRSPLQHLKGEAMSLMGHRPKYQETMKLAHGPKNDSLFFFLKSIGTTESFVHDGRRWHKKKSAKAQGYTRKN